MNPYDKAAVQSVWQRVQSGQPEELPDRERLALWIGAEACDHATLLSLAKQNPRAAAEFRRMAAEASQRARELSALCLFLHGLKPVLRPSPIRGNYVNQMRQCYTRAAHRAREYRRAAEAWPMQTPLFHRLAAQQEEQSLQLLRLATLY